MKNAAGTRSNSLYNPFVEKPAPFFKKKTASYETASFIIKIHHFISVKYLWK